MSHIFTRRILRIKAMQQLFAYFSNQRAEETEKNLLFLGSICSFCELEEKKVCSFFSFFSFLLSCWSRKIEHPQHDFFSFDPHLYFYFPQIWLKKGEEWYDSYLTTEIQQNKRSMEAKVWGKTIISHIFFKKKKISDWIESEDFFWKDNQGIVRHMLLQWLKKHLPYYPSIGNEEVIFFRKLIEKSIANNRSYEVWLSRKSQRWDLQRIALLESTLLKMAFTEMEQLTTPHPIIINEYIEIAKKYGSSNSHVFVHGMMSTFCKNIVCKS